MTTLIALFAFPCCAILWLLLCDRLGMVRDEPLIREQERGLVGNLLKNELWTRVHHAASR